MPIYEYECNACGERHEFIQKFSDAPKRKCPACGKSRLRKLISAAAFHLKGDGWYVTDFRDKDKKKGGKDDGAAASGDQAKPEAGDAPKSDSKADTKADSKADAKSGKKESKPKKGGSASASA